MMSPRTGIVVVCSVLATSAFALAQMAGCSSSTNSGTPTPPDAGSDGTTALTCSAFPLLQWFDSTNTGHAPDFSCYGGAIAEAGGPPTVVDSGTPSTGGDAGGEDGGVADDGGDDGGADAGDDGGDGAAPGPVLDTFGLADFNTHQAVSAAQVDLFFANTVIGATPDLTAITSDGTDGGVRGSFLFPPPTAPFAYRVTGSGLQPLVQYDNLPPAVGGTFAGNSIASSIYGVLVDGVIGSTTTAPGTSVIVAGVMDCAGHNLDGAIVQLVDGAGAVIPQGNAGTDLHEVYFKGATPGTNTTTYAQGGAVALWSALNVPTADSTMQLSGCLHATDAAPTVFSTHTVGLIPDSIVIPRAYKTTP